MNNSINNGSIKCVKCGKNSGIICSTDEIDFLENGEGKYKIDVYCSECKQTFRDCYEFKYEITDRWSY